MRGVTHRENEKVEGKGQGRERNGKGKIRRKEEREKITRKETKKGDKVEGQS